MSTTGPLATRGETRYADSTAPSGWLLLAFPSSSQRSIFLRATIATVAILCVEYLIEVVWLGLDYWTRWPFLGDPGVPLSALGLVFTFALLGQWGVRYVELWAEVRPAFDATEERYDAVVRRDLRTLYGRDYVPFLLFVGVQVGVYRLFPGALPAGYLHVGFLHFFAVTALYCLYRHVVTVARVTDLGVVDVARARPTLSEVADFGVVVGLTWFAALVSLLVYVGFFLLPVTPGLARVSLAELTLGIGSFYALVGLLLVAVGLLAFLVPVVLLHGALAAEKHDRLRAIEDEYDALFAAWSEEDLERDPSAGLDILEKRRRNAGERSTWPYRLASLGQLALGSVVPVALSVAKALGLAG